MNWYDGFNYRRGVQSTRHKSAPLKTSPHYTDKRFDNGPKTVFGKDADSPYGYEHLTYVYSDRLWQWDYSKMQESVDAANEKGHTRSSCHWYEDMLSHFLGEEVEIEHIMAGVNRSNGYPYYILGYTVKGES